MYVIKKYSASGLYSGEPVESFDTADGASRWLNAVANHHEEKDYSVDYFYNRDAMILEGIEISHDDLAEVITYNVVFEVDSEDEAS